MANHSTATPTLRPTVRATTVYAVAAASLVAGLAVGYLLPTSRTAAPATRLAASTAVAGDAGLTQHPAAAAPAGTTPQPSNVASPHGPMPGGRMPTLADMKRMADKQAAPLLDQLKKDPNNAAVLVQIGAIYHTTHQFQQAASYYGKAVQASPKDVTIRTKYATSLYRSGDVDGAISQLNQALKIDPKDANALFDLGMMRLQGKQDGKGAVAAWQTLLKTNPQLPADRKATVKKLMADVLTSLANQQQSEGAQR